MNESALSIFRKLPETKTQVFDYSKLIKNSVLDGEVDPLVFLQQISALELLIKTLKSDPLVKDVILEEAEKYGQKSFNKGNAKFQIKEVGTRYDFSVCCDLTWEELNSKVNEASEKKKTRETFLKSIDGETYGPDGVQLLPPKKTSQTQVVITLKS